MKAEHLQPLNEDSVLMRGLWISIIVHMAIFLFFTVRTMFFTPEKIDFSKAIRVDMVGLPEKIRELPSAPIAEEAKPTLPEKVKEEEKSIVEKRVDKIPPPKVAPKPDDVINLEKVKSKQKNALDKLKAMAALDKIKDEVAKESKDLQGKAQVPAKVKGNILSAGSSLTGLDKLQHETYIADLDGHIKKNWALPEWLAKRDYKAQVLLKFDSRGNVLSRKVVKSSGNPSYDEEALATIDRSAPFPPPPEKFENILSVDGILIGFPE